MRGNKESPPKTSPKTKALKITANHASDGGSIELAETVEESEADKEGNLHKVNKVNTDIYDEN
jgi:hypothetical protein